MVELVLAEARPLDFLEALDDAGDVRRHWRRRDFGHAALQVETGGAVTVRTADGALVLIVGLCPAPAAPDEAWAWFAPGPALAVCTFQAVRGARRLLEDSCRKIAPVTVKTFTADTGVAGARLAQLFGFTATGLLPSPRGPITIWTRRF